MKISTQFIKSIIGSISILLLLAPLTVLAQTKVVVIPLGDDAKPLKNIITVAKANGNFTDPVTAVNSISDASASNPYLVVIGPGVYTIAQTLVMKEYVDIVGSGENATKLTGAISTGAWDESSAIISGANNSILSSLTVENTGGSTLYVALYNSNASPTVSNIILKASGGTTNLGILNFSSSPTMRGVTVKASGGANNDCIQNVNSSPTMTDVTVTASGGTNTQGVYNDASSSPTMTGVTIKASGGTTSNIGVGNYSSSSLTMTNVSVVASGGTTNTGVENSYSSLTMTGVSVTASGGTYNTGVAIDHSSVTMTHISATASGGTNSIGVYNSSSSSQIRRSTMDGGTSSLFTYDATATVSQSTLMGAAGFGGSGTNKCVACDNGSGTALDATCQPIP
jgi:hypothetical protein